jgi:hypothetical protein
VLRELASSTLSSRNMSLGKAVGELIGNSKEIALPGTVPAGSK